MTAEVEQRWYSTADAARYLGCSVREGCKLTITSTSPPAIPPADG